LALILYVGGRPRARQKLQILKIAVLMILDIVDYYRLVPVDSRCLSIQYMLHTYI